MATLCRIPPVGTIYAFILDACNEKRVRDAVELYRSMNLVEQLYFQTEYPEVYQTFVVRVREFLRLT